MTKNFPITLNDDTFDELHNESKRVGMSKSVFIEQLLRKSFNLGSMIDD